MRNLNIIQTEYPLITKLLKLYLISLGTLKSILRVLHSKINTI